eukprot:3769802-Rhodomonas_salina.3
MHMRLWWCDMSRKVWNCEERVCLGNVGRETTRMRWLGRALIFDARTFDARSAAQQVALALAAGAGTRAGVVRFDRQPVSSGVMCLLRTCNAMSWPAQRHSRSASCSIDVMTSRISADRAGVWGLGEQGLEARLTAIAMQGRIDGPGRC